MARIASLLLLMAACAGTPKPPPQTAGSPQIVCREVTPTGSLFSHTECIPAEEAQAQTDAAQRLLRDLDFRGGQAMMR